MGLESLVSGIRNISAPIRRGATLGISTLTLLVLAACNGGASAQPATTLETQPAATATATPTPTKTPWPSPTPSPTPEPRYELIQDQQVPMNTYLEGDSCIDMIIQGEDKCVNMFLAGTYEDYTQQGGPDAGKVIYGDFPETLELSGVVYVVGDILANNPVIHPGTEIYIAANSDLKNLQRFEADMLSGINNIYGNEEYPGGYFGVHLNEPFRDEENHISLQIDGSLNINGTEEAPVLMTSDAEDPSRWDWNRLVFYGKGNINYTIIEYGRIISPGSGSEINNSIIRHFGECAVCLYDVNNVDIVGNHLYDVAHELIATHNVNGLYLVGNELGPNETLNEIGRVGGHAIVIDTVSGEIRDNVIYDNLIHGILFLTEPEEPFILENNEFYGNGRRDIFCLNVSYCNNDRGDILENNRLTITRFD